MIVLGGVFATTFIIIFVTFCSLFQSPAEQEMDMVVSESDISNLFSSKYPAIKYALSKDENVLFITGHVDSHITKKSLMFDINNLSPDIKIDDKVIIDENIIEAANRVLSEKLYL